jgi:hypothetical protein
MSGDVMSLWGECNVDPSRSCYFAGCNVAPPLNDQMSPELAISVKKCQALELRDFQGGQRRKGLQPFSFL